MISLYDDQEEFLGEIRNLWPHHRRIVAMASTGFGKTRVSARIVEGFVSRGMRVCFIVPRITLLQQTANAFIELGLTDITLLWADYDTDYSAKITIASIDTFIRREKGEYDICIVDECHHRRAKLLEWMNEHPKDRYLGMTATPYAPWMGQYYTALAKSKPMWWLIENKRLAPYDVFAPTHPDLSKARTTNTPFGRDYVEADISEIMGDAPLVGKIVDNWLENGENRLTIGLCVNKAHAGQITNEFNKYGVMAELITCDVPVHEREGIFRRAKEGITKIILSVDCLTEGLDLPECECLINARPTKSKTRFVQGCGRVLRYVEGKKALIFDHAGTFLDRKLGYIEYIDIDELSATNDGSSKEAKKLEEERLEKLPKECTACHYLKPAGVYVCPKCGFKPIYGEDIETDTTRGLAKLSRGKAPKKFTREEKQKAFSMLKGYQAQRAIKGKPISDGWCAHKYRELFDVWPNGLSDEPLAPDIKMQNWIKYQNIKFAKGKKKAENANS